MMMVLSSSFLAAPWLSCSSSDCLNGLLKIRIKHHQNQSSSTCSLRCYSQLDLLPPSFTAPAAATSASYGALLLAGGLFAYTRSGSKGSLIGGLAGSSLMAAAFVLMQAPETKTIGDSLAFGSALLFTFVFSMLFDTILYFLSLCLISESGIRLAATGKVIPAGPLLGLSLGALVVFVSAYLQDTL